MTQLTAMQSRALQPIIYFPIELGVRELDSRALLASLLVTQGYHVVIGQQWLFYANIARLPPGAVLFKSFNKIHHPYMRTAKQAGHRVVLLEEELLGHTDEKAIAALCTEGIFELAHLILSNGKLECDILKKMSKGSVRIEITGNARIDLLKPALRAFFQPKIDGLRSKYGNFILVNTNFGLINSVWGTAQVMQFMVKSGYFDPRKPESLQAMREYVDFEKANYSALVAAIQKLAKQRPNQTIVVRPHPAEDLSKWNGSFPGVNNVVVIRDGSHVPWTLGSSVLLHTSCTTGFEAHVAERVALSLVPRAAMISTSMISNYVNHTYENAEDLVATAEKTLDGNTPEPKQIDAAKLESYVWNYGSNNGFERIAKHLTMDLPSPRQVSLPGLEGVVRLEEQVDKFTLSKQGCADVLSDAARALGLGNRPDVRELGDSLFLASPAAGPS
jgi:surface carbohydrate biosynthesis protein